MVTFVLGQRHNEMREKWRVRGKAIDREDGFKNLRKGTWGSIYLKSRSVYFIVNSQLVSAAISVWQAIVTVYGPSINDDLTSRNPLVDRMEASGALWGASRMYTYVPSINAI